MENLTLSDASWTPMQTAEFFGKRINLPLFKEMLTTFFKAKASDKGNQLLRRPQIAVRLLDGEEHVYTIRPGWKSPTTRLYEKDKFVPNPSDLVLDPNVRGGLYVRVQEFGKLDFNNLFVDAIHQEHGKCARFSFDDACLTMRSWHPSRYFEALNKFAETTKDFIFQPWLVFGRGKDRCCICSKPLTDEISRGRGVGPECLRQVSNCFGHLLKK